MLDTQYSGRNVGDIFYTLRKDSTLNGAVPCNGQIFYATDFVDVAQENNPYLLCVNKILPSLSFLDYDKEVALRGSCASFGLDTSSGAFKVPTLNNIYIQATGNTTSIAEYLKQQLPDMEGKFTAESQQKGGSATGVFSGSSIKHGVHSGTGGAYNNKITFKASDYDPDTYVEGGMVRPPSVILRAMVQLIVPQDQEQDSGGGDSDIPGIQIDKLRIPYVHVPGTAAKATEVNANFEYVIKYLMLSYNNPKYVYLDGEQSIAGKKIFEQNPIMPAIDLIPEKGSVHGGVIDFHYGGSDVYTARISETSKGCLSLNASPPSEDSSLKIPTTAWTKAEITSSINSAQNFSIGSFVYTVKTEHKIAKNTLTSLNDYLPKDNYQYLVWVDTEGNAASFITDLVGDLGAGTWDMQGIRTTVVPVGPYNYIDPSSSRYLKSSQVAYLVGYMRIGKV